MDLQDRVSLAYRAEWKPFPTVHQSGRPKSAGAGHLKVHKFDGAARATEAKFGAQVCGKNMVLPKNTEFSTLHAVEGRKSASESGKFGSTSSDPATAPVDIDYGPLISSSCSSTNHSPGSKSVHEKQRTFYRQHSRETSTSVSAIDEAKSQKYLLQNMTALLHKSVQQGCAFVPKGSTPSKAASQKRTSSFTIETANNASVPSKVSSTAEDRYAVPTSELVTSICEIRSDLRTDDQISILMKQIQTNAFLSKLPNETLRELCRVMKVQFFYRRDRVFIQGDIGEHFFIILEGKCVVYKELSMLQAKEMQLDLSGNDPSVSVTTVANKDWNLGVMTALRAKGASAKILEKVKSREKNTIVKKIVEIKQKLQRLGESEEPAVRVFTETLRQELASLTEHLENIMVKLGKFSGDVLQTQIEETIEEALRASQAETLRSQTASNDVFDVHEVSKHPSDADTGNADSQESLQSKADNPVLPITEGAAKIASPEQSAPTYNLTEFLAADTKIVIKKLVELSVGAAFGEIALENANSKRTATIVAETDCKLISITRADYRNVLSEIFAKKKANDIAFLKEVPIFSKLNPKTLETLQSVMSHQTYQADQVILEAESETSDFYIVVSGIVRAVMRFSFEEVGSKSILESDSAPSTKHAQKVRNPTELAICKLGTQNTFGEFYVGRKAKSPVAFVADSSQVVVLRLALLDCQHYLAVDSSIHSQLMNFARQKSEFYLAQCKAMLKTKGSSYQLASARRVTSSSMIPYPSEAELLALIGEKPKPPKIKTDIAAWTRLFPTKQPNPTMPPYWRHNAWRETFEQKQHDIATALNKIDEFQGVTVVGTHVLFPAQDFKFCDSQTVAVKHRPASATLRVDSKRGEDASTRSPEYSVKNRTLNLQSWDMPAEHHVNVSNRVDSSQLLGKKNFYYAFDPDEPDADYLEDLDLLKMDGPQ